MSMVPAPAAPRRTPRVAPRSTPSRPPLTVVRPRPSTPARRAPFVLLVAGILSVGLVTLLLLNTALSQGSFTLTDLQERAAALADREQALAQQLAGNESPTALAAAAGSLGMVPSRNPVFLRVPDGAILGQPQPGVASPAPTSGIEAPTTAVFAAPATPTAGRAATTPVDPVAQPDEKPPGHSGGEFAVDRAVDPAARATRRG